MARRIIAGLLCLGALSAQAQTRAIDGDTVIVNGVRIRLENIDTPELRARCAAEFDKAVEAKRLIEALLAQGEPVVKPNGVDRYGRTLARITVNGIDIGEALIKAGLAIKWSPGRAAYAARLNHWCPQ